MTRNMSLTASPEITLQIDGLPTIEESIQLQTFEGQSLPTAGVLLICFWESLCCILFIQEGVPCKHHPETI